MSAGDVFRLSRTLRELALIGTADKGESQPALGLVLITDDIAHHAGSRVADVVERTGLAQSLVSRTVAELREAGIVRTWTDEDDRRVTRIAITDAARSRVFRTRGARGITTALTERYPTVGPRRIAAIEAAMARLLEALPD